MLSFDGAWIRERYQHERKLTAGECSIGSICGTSSNRHNPFFAIRKGDCNEQAGECWGINLVYSGNHIGRVEVAPHGMVRVQNGINRSNSNGRLHRANPSTRRNRCSPTAMRV